MGKVPLQCRPGPSTGLTAEEEDALMQTASKWRKLDMGLGGCYEDSVAERSRRSHPFKDGMAGRGWLDVFLQRHPRLTLRTPHNLRFARARASTNATINLFFLNLLSKPMQVYNADETGITVVHKPGRVLAEPGLWTTVIPVSSALYTQSSPQEFLRHQALNFFIAPPPCAAPPS